jgi:hypothetical protein
MSAPAGGLARWAHRAMLRTQGGRLRPAWRLAHEVAVRALIAWLTRGQPGTSGYVAGSLGSGDAIYGLSDIDTIVVLAHDPDGAGRRRVRARWDVLERAAPALGLLVDPPRVYEQADLSRRSRSSLTHGLEEARASSGYHGPGTDDDARRLLDRPGLHGPAQGWRLLRGPERRPPAPRRDRQEQRIAAWLELGHWWRWLFGVCAEPQRPRSADACVKFIAEPARVWLWVAHGERPAGRDEVLRRAAARLPEQAPVFDLALYLRHSLSRSPPAPVAEALGAALSLTARVAALLEAEIAGAGVSSVRLLGGDGPLALAKGGLNPGAGHAERLVALCDWRQLVMPELADEALAPLEADAGDPHVLGRMAAAATRGAYPALRWERLLVLPSARWFRGVLRCVQCRATDPVSFALLEGRAEASFPDVPGWSVGDWARRAVAEHRGWLTHRAPEHPGHELARLVTAARAALLLETWQADEPELAVTADATLRALDGRWDESLVAEVAGAYGQFATYWTEPPASLIAALRGSVMTLEAYAESPARNSAPKV